MIAREDHLFGLLAVQCGLVDPVAFLDARDAVHEGERLPDLLVRRGLLVPEDCEHLFYLVRRKLPAAEVPSAHPATITFAPVPGRYHYLDLCGSGGMGDVWHGRDTKLDRDVAVKELKPHLADNQSARARFLREARITSQLDHPGIVPIYDLLPEQDGRPRYAMRLLRGRTLSEAIRTMHRRRAAGEDVALERAGLLQAFVAVCNTVGYAHSRGVVHRDLKPANVQLGDFGEVVVLDWGLAATVCPGQAPEDSDECLTRQGSVLGTPEYMAPEQAAGDTAHIDACSDIYGLGAILYCLLTGEPPFRGASMWETLALVRAGELTPVREHCPDVPAGLEAICHRALSRRPEDRYALATDLAAAVLGWQESERLAAEQALRESEERFRTLARAVPQSLWIARPDGWIEYSNDGTSAPGRVRMHQEIQGTRWQTFVHPDDLPEVVGRWEKVQAEGNIYAVEYRWQDPDGVYRWLRTQAAPLRDSAGQIVKWFGSVTDIHDLKQAIQERDEALGQLGVSEQRYRLLADLIPQNVWTATPEGELLYANLRSLESHGMTPDEGTGDAWQRIVHPDDLTRSLERWRHSLLTGEPVEIEFRLRDHAGVYRWHLSRAVAVRDGQGRIVQWFGTNTDIDRLKQVEAERDAALRRLECAAPALALLVLRTPALERTLEFYAALGFTFVRERHGDGPVHFAGQAGPVLLELYPHAGTLLGEQPTRLGFAVADLAATVAALQAAGVVVEKPPRRTPWGLRAEVRDPDGRVVELGQR